MSFRIEKKYLIQPNQILEVNNWLSKNNFSKLYSGRQIESIYLENYQNDMFLNSEEGCVPRKKIRLRAYPQNQKKIKKFLLEIKTTSVEGRFKSTKKINERQSLKILNNGYTDTLYGICKKKLKVNFYRTYFKFDNYRITLDKHIKYSNIINSYYKYSEKYYVLEIKTPITSDYNFIEKLPFHESRFSKYCRGYISLFN